MLRQPNLRFCGGHSVLHLSSVAFVQMIPSPSARGRKARAGVEDSTGRASGFAFRYRIVVQYCRDLCAHGVPVVRMKEQINIGLVPFGAGFPGVRRTADRIDPVLWCPHAGPREPERARPQRTICSISTRTERRLSISRPYLPVPSERGRRHHSFTWVRLSWLLSPRPPVAGKRGISKLVMAGPDHIDAHLTVGVVLRGSSAMARVIPDPKSPRDPPAPGDRLG
jgi:hypothetical protein